MNENDSIEDEMRTAQENLRLSANQNKNMMKQINEYKMKIEENLAENTNLKEKIGKMTSENANLNEEVRVAQDNLRLSANNMTKMKN